MDCLFLKPEGGDRVEAVGLNRNQFAAFAFTNADLSGRLPDRGLLVPKRYLADLKKGLDGEEILLNTDDKRLFVRSVKRGESVSLPLTAHTYPD
jgi:hypothetical protein